MTESKPDDVVVQVEANAVPQHNKLLGFIVILLGVGAIAAPLLTQLSITVIAGWILIFVAVSRGISAIMDREEGGLLLGLLVAVLTMVVGIFLLTKPIPSVLTITLLLAILFLVEGVILIVRGFTKRWEIINWSTLVVNGFVSCLLGVFILVSFPSSARWAIGLLLGIYLLLAGYRMMSSGSSNIGPEQEK